MWEKVARKMIMMILTPGCQSPTRSGLENSIPELDLVLLKLWNLSDRIVFDDLHAIQNQEFYFQTSFNVTSEI